MKAFSLSSQEIITLILEYSKYKSIYIIYIYENNHVDLAANACVIVDIQ